MMFIIIQNSFKIPFIVDVIILQIKILIRALVGSRITENILVEVKK
jgi:hypothetical protein